MGNRDGEMKKIMTLMCLTVMLRVWYYDQNTCNFYDFDKSKETLHTGICVSGFGTRRGNPFLIVRKDDGTMHNVCSNGIVKTKWVEVKAERDK